jgi:GT2 family glycosyltransferase
MFVRAQLQPDQTRMKLSIVIVNYNVRYFLEQCLLSVFKALDNIEAEVWVVDNNSVDGSVEMVRKKFTGAKIIENKENVGFSKANNQAIAKCSGEYILLLNPDTIVEEETFSKCISFMDEHTDAGALGVRMIDGKGKFLPESKRGLPTPEVALYKMFGLNRLFPKSERFGKYHLSYLSENETHQIDVLSGAFMFIRRKALDISGQLDETFFMYGEDIDLSYRITKAGYKNYYFPETTIIHYKGESTKKQSVNYVFVFYRAMIIFARKHYQSGHANLLVLFINMAIYLRAGLAVVRRFFQNSWLVFSDAAFIVIGMYFLKEYWQEHIKIIKEIYPKELMTIHVPYYTFLWIVSVCLSGGYSQPYSFRRVLRGVAVGTLLILAVYGLFPNELRFSRALIILGAGISLIVMMGWRLLHHFIQYGNITLETTSSAVTLLVGRKSERERVKALMLKSGVQNEVIGFVSLGDKDDDYDKGMLGKLEQLDEIVKIYKIRQIIFCSADVASKDIMYWMGKIGAKDIMYKIVPQESMFIIGSNSKNTTGELYTEEITLALSLPLILRKKRIFDFLSSLILLPFSPILALFSKKPLICLKHLAEVLTGKKSWVGYSTTQSVEHLPKLKPGILTTSSEIRNAVMDEKTLDRMNFLYAKNYTIEKDFNLLLFNIFNI